VRLIIEIQTVGDKFVEIDFRRSFATALARSAGTTAKALFTTSIASPVPTPLTSSIASSIVGSSAARLAAAPILTRWAIFAFLALVRFLLFNFRHSIPFDETARR
jgi:hypothetical protein